jgi:hypothetical protein
MKKTWMTVMLILGVIGAVYITTFTETEREMHEMQPARVNDGKIELNSEDGFMPITIKGVNMGMAKPGYFPGEAMIEEDEYYRWFEMIGGMNANTVRVYTLHPPGFYQALKDYNQRNPEASVYVMHGVWADEDKMHEGLDAFEEELNEEFEEDIKYIIDAVHGNAKIEETLGKAHGSYTADVSEYVISWMIGVEWFPPFVMNTNEVYSKIGDFSGEYYSTEEASAFERWLAEKMEFTTAYDHATYGSLRPMSFTNWVTTDILDHPSDASDMEDVVSVDPNVIYTEGAMEAVGQFASYHVYPYYPDFLNYEPDYVEYEDHRGEKNNYAGYLSDLHQVHRLPILIAEFGLPASRGMTHRNPFGLNQGFISEVEQGEYVVRMFEDILHEGMMGGLVFTWQDEWFKRTWNTMDYDNPDARPYWSNAQTNEEQFGLLSFDTHKIGIDGYAGEWDAEPIYVNEEGGTLKTFSMDHDERYLYFLVEHHSEFDGEIDIPLDIIPGQGNHNVGDVKSEDAMDFIIQIHEDTSRIVVDDYYDFFKIQYGHNLGMIETEGEPEKNSGRYNEIHYALNKELFLPDRNEVVPFESYETGVLREGIGDPEAEDYDSLSDYYWNRDEGVLEIRIPWMLISARDPSAREFIGDIAADGLEASVSIEGIKAGVLMREGETVVASHPSIKDGRLERLALYRWDEWDLPEYEERLKKSYKILKDAFQHVE